MSKIDCQAMARHIIVHPHEVMTLLQVAEHYIPGQTWRAGWVISTLGEMGFIGPKGYVPAIIRLASSSSSDDSLVRGVLRGLAPYKSFTEDDEGALTDTCLSLLERPNVAVSTVFASVEMLLKICTKYPELWPELIGRLDRFEGETTPGFLAIRRKVATVHKKAIKNL
jgi:hypothetical protein